MPDEVDPTRTASIAIASADGPEIHVPQTGFCDWRGASGELAAGHRVGSDRSRARQSKGRTRSNNDRVDAGPFDSPGRRASGPSRLPCAGRSAPPSHLHPQPLADCGVGRRMGTGGFAPSPVAVVAAPIRPQPWLAIEQTLMSRRDADSENTTTRAARQGNCILPNRAVRRGGSGSGPDAGHENRSPPLQVAALFRHTASWPTRREYDGPERRSLPFVSALGICRGYARMSGGEDLRREPVRAFFLLRPMA